MNQLLFENPPTLIGERIKLVPLQEEHAKPLFTISYPEVWTYMLSRIVTDKEMNTYVSEALHLRQQMKALPFIVVLKESNQVVGTTRLYEMNSTQKSCELGATWYAKKVQRTFVNSECKYLLLKYCFEELKFIRVQIKTDERNIRSQNAIERIGAVKEGILRNERILDNGYIRNAVLYSITNDDWHAVKQGFIDRAISYSAN